MGHPGPPEGEFAVVSTLVQRKNKSLKTSLCFVPLGLSGHEALSGTFSHSQRTQSGIFRQNQAKSGKIRHFQAFSKA